MRIRILTVLWGREFAGRFLRFGMRSLLAPGNLPDICLRHDVSYEIYAPVDDITHIKGDPAFAALARIVEVRFHPFALGAIDPANPMSHWNLWHGAIADARRDDVYVILAAPDQIFARDTLQRWAGLFEDRYLAVFSTGVQLVMETFVEEIAERFADDQPIDLSQGALRDLMFRHLHPIKIAMFRNSPRLITHPEWDLRAVPGEGFLQRTLSSHAYGFHPGRIRLTRNFCPVEQFDRVAFEPSCFIGIEPMLKYLGLYMRPWRMDEAALSYHGTWDEQFVLPVNRRESALAHAYPIRSAISESKRRRAQLGGNFYVGQMRAAGAIVRVWRALRDAGLDCSARWLAAGHMHGRLRRRLPLTGPVTLFAPADEAFRGLTVADTNALLERNGAALIAAFRSHVASGHHALAPGDRLALASDGPIVTKDGRRYAKAADGEVLVLRAPIRVDDVDIVAIDGVLTSQGRSPSVRSDRLQSARLHMRGITRRSRREGKAWVIGLLERNRRLHALALSLRARLFTRDQEALPATGFAGKSAPAVALFERAMAARSLRALRDHLGFYATQVLAGALPHAPQVKLADLPVPTDTEILNWLTEAISLSPRFAEAWLEMGYLRQDGGDQNAALTALKHAQDGQPLIARQAIQSNPRLIAAMERAKLLLARGKHADALLVLEAAPVARQRPWTFDVLHARILLALGRGDAALAAFERCLEWRLLEPGFAGNLPPSFDALAKTLKV